jgi:hypothetical protein
VTAAPVSPPAAALAPASRHVAARPNGLLMVLGKTPMFFYLFHIPCLEFASHALHLEHALGLGGTFFFAAAVVAALYPLCLVYSRYKAAHPERWTRYV